jgi:hypothetical protein
MTNTGFNRIITYLPPLTFVIFATLSGFFPALLDALSVQYVLALVGLTLLGVGAHLEAQYSTTTTNLKELQKDVHSLKSTQEAYIDRTLKPICPSSLAAGFQQQAIAGSRIGTLRVFAISSQQILTFMRFEGFKVEHCMLLLRAFPERDVAHRDFRNQILLAVRDWRALAKDGRIEKLTIRSYDFLPTEYQVIFDNRAMLLGLYESEPTDYSEVRVRQPFYVDGGTSDGRALVEEYRTRFDKLFDACLNSHGPNPYEVESGSVGEEANG